VVSRAYHRPERQRVSMSAQERGSQPRHKSRGNTPRPIKGVLPRPSYSIRRDRPVVTARVASRGLSMTPPRRLATGGASRAGRVSVIAQARYPVVQVDLRACA